uniref:PAS domain-containing protein n=1 Tax=Globisporangium ultimum (strain ATCC 200006 / CBS 805.95 / DAOM BR144) TaxID=431595 RepID=K3X931_GLOUD
GGSGRASGSGPALLGHPQQQQQQNAPKPQPRNSVIRKIMQQTIGENFEHSSIPQMQSFVNSVETYCATTESLASLGKSLYTSTTMVFVVDELMRIILWNDFAIKLSGFGREEMAGRNLLNDVPFLVPPQTANALSEALARCMQGVPLTGTMLEFTKRDRSKLTLLTTCTPLLSNPAGQGMLVIGHDISHVSQPLIPPPAPAVQYDNKSLAGTPAISDHG